LLRVFSGTNSKQIETFFGSYWFPVRSICRVVFLMFSSALIVFLQLYQKKRAFTCKKERANVFLHIYLE